MSLSCSSDGFVQLEKTSAKTLQLQLQLRLSQPCTPASQPAEVALTQLLRELDAAWKVKPQKLDVPPVMWVSAVSGWK